MEQIQEPATLFIVKQYYYLGINFWNFVFDLIEIALYQKKKNRVSPKVALISYQCMSQIFFRTQVVTVNIRAELSSSPIRFCLHSWDVFMISDTLY